MHPSPCSTKIFSHSETGVVNVTAARSFMYPDTGRSSWPLMDATSTSVMDTTPSKMPPLSSASLPSLPPGWLITGQLRWSCRSSKSPRSPMVMLGCAEITLSALRITSFAVFCGGIWVVTICCTNASRIPSTDPAIRASSTARTAASTSAAVVTDASTAASASTPLPSKLWSILNAADAAFGCPPPFKVCLNTDAKSTSFTGFARPITETCRYGFFLPCTYDTAMSKTSESVKSKTSLAHCAIPGVYSRHSTCTREIVRPSAVVLTTSLIPRAMTSLWSAVSDGLQYSAKTFCDAPFSKQYASAFASLGVVFSKVKEPVSA
mmetsp:Transcript_10560/g.39125  ORF Transcript_10560/g.39125 Transcript_10560/m.39125 type:complete len:321 (+) Transcript_10560:827-1789(+)